MLPLQLPRTVPPRGPALRALCYYLSCNTPSSSYSFSHITSCSRRRGMPRLLSWQPGRMRFGHSTRFTPTSITAAPSSEQKLVGKDTTTKEENSTKSLGEAPDPTSLASSSSSPEIDSLPRRRTPSRTQLPPRPRPPPENEIEERFLRGSGPGGQKINKTSSLVQLRHVPTNILVKCQATRSREQNRSIARDILATRIDELVNGERSRTAVVTAYKRRKKDSASKKKKRKYRRLDGDRVGDGDGDGDGDSDSDGDGMTEAS